MARIVFAAPGVDRFHLHDRLGRELAWRGHEVESLHLESAAARFWRAQQLPSTLLAPAAPDPMRAPLTEIAVLECARRGLPAAGALHRRVRKRIVDRLAALLPGLMRQLGAAPPDLVLLHGARSAERRLVHFVGRELGHPVLWTGHGLLPHTLQADPRGLDAEASTAGRDPYVYRSARAEPPLLDACLAHVLAGAMPYPLPRRAVHAPPLLPRLLDALAAWRWDGIGTATRTLRLWREATPRPSPAPADFLLPAVPFVAVLLQSPRDERLRLDAESPPTADALVAEAAAAARSLDPRMPTVAVLPPGGLRAGERTALHHLPGVRVAPATAAAVAATSAVAVVTVNHPLAVAAMLAGTPVLHTGRALYELHSVTHHVTASELPRALREAAGADRVAALRARFLTWLVDRAHVWCSPTHPDYNGILGLADAVASQAGAPRPTSSRLQHRPGPAWPLSVPRPPRSRAGRSP